MKKKLLIIILSVLLVVAVALAIVLSRKSGKKEETPFKEISVESWDTGKLFVFGELEAKNVSYGSCFVPTTFFYLEDKENFEKEILNHESYIGRGFIHYIGAIEENGWFFCYNDAIYGIMRWNAGYLLHSFRTRFSYVDSRDEYETYCYLSIVDYVPSNAYDSERNFSFDEMHSSYEDFAAIYGQLSENVAKLDDENQIIYLRMYEFDTHELVNDKCVCIDFGIKDVYVKEEITW